VLNKTATKYGHDIMFTCMQVCQYVYTIYCTSSHCIMLLVMHSNICCCLLEYSSLELDITNSTKTPRSTRRGSRLRHSNGFGRHDLQKQVATLQGITFLHGEVLD